MTIVKGPVLQSALEAQDEGIQRRFTQSTNVAMSQKYDGSLVHLTTTVIAHSSVGISKHR